MKHKTRVGYQHAIDKSIKPYLGKVKLVDLKREDIQRMYAALTKAGKSFYVLKEVRAVLNGAFNEAILANKIDINPVSAVKLPQKPKVKPTYFEASEAQKLLAKAEERGELARWLVAKIHY
jgi:site-specific recombinase XerC